MAKLIATRGIDLQLFATSNGQGYVLNVGTGEKSSIFPLGSLLNRGYWRSVNPTQFSEPHLALSEHSGVMIAFHVPSDIAQKIAVANGEKDLHLTLIYLGDSTELDNKDELKEQLELFSGAWASIKGKIRGFGRWPASSNSDGKEIVYASYDAPFLPGFRQALAEILGYKPQEHGFIPHITLAYVPENEATPIDRIDEIDLIFDAIYLHWGDEVTEYGLDGTLKLGSSKSGHHGHSGIPGQVGGSARSLRYVPAHVWQRANERASYKKVKEAITKIKSLDVFPTSKKVSWHLPLPGGILVGSNAAAQTFLAPTMTVKEGSMEITI